MGQKVLPISLRLQKEKNWQSQWISDNHDYPSLLHFDLEIRRLCERTINNEKDNTNLLNLKIRRISNNIWIYVYVQKAPKGQLTHLKIRQLVRVLNASWKGRYHVKMFFFPVLTPQPLFQRATKAIFPVVKKRFRINFKIKKLIYMFINALFNYQFQVLTEFLKDNLQKRKRHRGYIYFFNNVLTSLFHVHSRWMGYKLQIKGRINGSKRKRKMVFQKGKMPLNTLKYPIQSTFNEFKTPSGICSIKMWFFFLPGSSPRSLRLQRPLRQTQFKSFISSFKSTTLYKKKSTQIKQTAAFQRKVVQAYQREKDGTMTPSARLSRIARLSLIRPW